MDYLEKAEQVIRSEWFSEHEIKSIEGENGFQKIIFGEPGTFMYRVNYVLVDNMVYISGDLGVAAYALTGPATIEEISRYNLSYFTGKLVASQRAKYEFDEKHAAKEIKEYFLDWCEVDSVSDLNSDDKKLFYELIEETQQWSLPQHFNTAVYHVYQNTEVEWFDSEAASCIADCGQQLSYSVISYWVGLKMIAELQAKANQA